MEKFVQVGVFALRSPQGEFLPSVPLYIKATDAVKTSESSGLSVAEEITETSRDVARLFAEKHKQYIEGVNSEKRKQGSRRAEV